MVIAMSMYTAKICRMPICRMPIQELWGAILHTFYAPHFTSHTFPLLRLSWRLSELLQLLLRVVIGWLPLQRLFIAVDGKLPLTRFHVGFAEAVIGVSGAGIVLHVEQEDVDRFRKVVVGHEFMTPG